MVADRGHAAVFSVGDGCRVGSVRRDVRFSPQESDNSRYQGLSCAATVLGSSGHPVVGQPALRTRQCARAECDVTFSQLTPVLQTNTRPKPDLGLDGPGYRAPTGSTKVGRPDPCGVETERSWVGPFDRALPALPKVMRADVRGEGCRLEGFFSAYQQLFHISTIDKAAYGRCDIT